MGTHNRGAGKHQNIFDTVLPYAQLKIFTAEINVFLLKSAAQY